MANVIPLVVSGQINPGQPSILMSIVDSTPYYLVSDVNHVPYFQPLYQDVATGLDVFSSSAMRVTVSIGPRTGSDNSVIITSLAGASAGGGNLIIDPTILRIVAPNSISGASSTIPIELLSYADQTLVACGYEYVVDQGITFYITTNWSATPSSQSIGLVQQQPPTNSFYVYPVDGLVDSSGKPASASIFSTIYNDVLGRTPTTFLFTSKNAWQIGGGEPYYYCPDSACGPLCFGTCKGEYAGCERLKDNTFSCRVTASPTCKVLALLPFIIPAVLSIIAFAIVFFTNKYLHIHPTTTVLSSGVVRPSFLTHHVYVFPQRIKVILSILLLIPALLVIIMLILASIDTGGSNWYLRSVCRVTGDYS